MTEDTVVFGETNYQSGPWYYSPGNSPASSNWQNRQRVQSDFEHYPAIDFYLKELEKREEQCQPLFRHLRDKISDNRLWTGTRDPIYGGQWIPEEGTVFVNVIHAYGANFDEAGNATEQLWRTLVEEAVHAWFDSDVDHGAYGEWSETNRRNAVDFCGKWRATQLSGGM